MTTTTPEPRTYGNWFARQSPGLGRMGMIGTILLLAGAMAAIVAKSLFGLAGGVAVLALEVPALGPLLWRNRSGRNGWQVVLGRLAWRVGVAKGQDVYVAGLAGPTLFGTTKLPGLARNTP